MRLLVVTNDYPPRPGGIQQYLGNLVSHYPDEALVIAPARDEAPSNDDPRVVRHPTRFMWPTPRTARWIGDQARVFQPDAVLIGAPVPLAAIGSKLQETIGAPVGVLCHGAEVTVPGAIPVVRSLLRTSLRGAAVRFAVSRFTARKVESLTGMPAHYVGGGVDVARFRPDGERTAPSVPVVGCVSRFVPRKGQGRLVEAVAELRRRGRQVELRLVGSGRTERRLRREAAAAGVPVRFDVAVSWDRLPELYRSMDVFAMPCRSRWFGLEVEGLGLVYLEAAACGLPVIAGDSGGAPETVEPGRTGYLASDAASIVSALERILDMPDRGREWGEAGRAMVESRFVWAEVVTRLIEGFAGAARPRGMGPT